MIQSIKHFDDETVAGAKKKKLGQLSIYEIESKMD